MSDASDHRHCKVCGRICDVGSETCSRACREKRAQQIAARRNWTYFLYAMMALLLIVAVSYYVR